MVWASKSGKPIVAGPLLDFSKRAVPEWMYVWQNDYERISNPAELAQSATSPRGVSGPGAVKKPSCSSSSHFVRQRSADPLCNTDNPRWDRQQPPRTFYAGLQINHPRRRDN